MFRKAFVALGCCVFLGGIIGIAKASLMPIKALIGQHYLEVAWQESLKTNKLSKPWKSADFYMIGELTVPRLNISRVILNSVSGEAMSWGIGRVNNTNRLSMNAPTVLAGHRDSHMKFMSKLNVGDRIEVVMSDGLLNQYIITHTEITNNPKLQMPMIAKKQDGLILTTCWPFNSLKQGDQRYVIYSDRII